MLLNKIILLIIFVGTININASSKINFPEKFSKLNGWKSFKLVKEKRCKPCYSLEIPTNYGLNNEQQIAVLIQLANLKSNPLVDYDLDGPFFISYDVMDHFLNLAINKQYEKAGSIVLFPKKYQIDLGLSSYEHRMKNYLVPLLINFENLSAIVNKSDYKKIAKLLSVWSRHIADFTSVNHTIKQLKKRNYIDLASVIESACKEEKLYMQNKGYEYNE